MHASLRRVHGGMGGVAGPALSLTQCPARALTDEQGHLVAFLNRAPRNGLRLDHK
jgi:hypothetical protein